MQGLSGLLGRRRISMSLESRLPFLATLLFLSVGSSSAPIYAQKGDVLYKEHCAICHEAGASGDSHAPGRDVLRQLTPEQILQKLEKGAMKAQAAERSRKQRQALAEYLSGKPFGSELPNPIPKSAFCSSSAQTFRNSLDGPAWNGWGVSVTNSRFESTDAAGMIADDVPQLKLKWAFGFPGA